MEFFALLTAATIMIAILALVVCLKRGDVGVLVGSAALYYWSLFGAWFIVMDKSGLTNGLFYYQYLERKLFPVLLDANYKLALELYTVFQIAVLLTLLAAVKPPRLRPLPRLVLRHDAILFTSMLAGVASFLLIRGALSTAWALHTSAYAYTRTQPSAWFSLHQILNRVALIPSAVGFATLIAGERSRYFVNVHRRYTLAGYAVLFAGMGTFTFVLGNKNEVLMALITGLLAYLGSVRRPHLLKVGMTLLAGLWFLYTIDTFRGVSIPDMETTLVEKLNSTTEVSRFLTASNEWYEAHVSMYGVLAGNIEPRFGYSFYSLACSVIPRVIWPSRPPDIYVYYSEQVGAIQDQGYTVNHATGWYLNFGVAGVVLGGVVLGLVWAFCLNAARRIDLKSGLPFRLFAAAAPWLFPACLPALIRAGPEAYKGFVIEGVLIPLGILLLACRPKRAKRRVPATGGRWAMEPVPVRGNR
ncbi:MAG TPA: hypothetical protein VGN17_24080 [Bryobacteraceae bacterium]|jgi:hypothetical protein